MFQKDDNEMDKVRRSRRARGARTLPRSGAGIHEDKKSKKIEKDLAEEAEEEMRNWLEYLEDKEIEDATTNR